ncbi:CPBP family intramembrane metalloprotease [Fusibacter paucivorans]|uniref:CPBP family intramembrane metalloprotease n=1 Tax=Fusibacter paucivorans TaxID=76009 RepID=A0ABS5PLZ4_9FIRM|nr:CPBP family intramembrane glutamic endopeptidase [Fusibacter paucivorans]MBS7525424.1 CPBP family intramembrane metalloprotease [Fusibacter paucivorans]
MNELVVITMILCGILSIPWGIYALSANKEMRFFEWVDYKQISKFEFIFLGLCIVWLYLTNTIKVIPFVIALFILLFSLDSISNDAIKIEKNQNLMKAFVASFLLYMSIQLACKYLNLFSNVHLYRLVLTTSVFLGYLFNIKVSSFHWTTAIKTIIVMLVVYFFIEIPYLLIYDIEALKAVTFSGYLASFVGSLYFPSIVEEVIFRGFLLGGLVSLGIRKDKANIFQAIVFGYIHLLNYESITLVSFLWPSFQVFAGYLFGKIYLSTKSLTPCLILHALFDTI